MQLHTLHTSEKGPVILWGMYEFRERELLNTYETIESLTGDCDYTLLAFEVMDWNRELFRITVVSAVCALSNRAFE